MNRAFLTAGALAVWLVACAPPNPEESYRRARSYFDQGLIGQAIEEYQVALRQKPDWVEAQRELAEAFYAAGRYEEAVVAATKSAELAPKDSEPLMFKGMAQLMAAQATEAEKTFDQVLELAPGYALALFNRDCARGLQSGSLNAACYAKLAAALGEGRLPAELGMRPAYEEVIASCPKFTTARFNLALIHLNDGDKEAATGLLNAAIELDPGFAPAQRWVGRLAAGKGQFKEAAAAYEAAVASDPGLSEAHFELAVVYQRLNDKKKAIAELKTYLEQQPEGEFSEQARERLKGFGVKQG